MNYLVRVWKSKAGCSGLELFLLLSQRAVCLGVFWLIEWIFLDGPNHIQFFKLLES